MKLMHGFSLLLGLVVATGCVKQKAADQGDRQDTKLSQFALTGKICGEHLSFVDYAKDGGSVDAERRFNASIDLAVCGTLNGDKDTDWMALATSLTTGDAYLRLSLEDGVEEAGHLVRRQDGAVQFVDSTGTTYTIGKVAVGEEGEPLELAAKVKAALFVDDEPFDLSRHAKGEPGKKLVFIVSAH